VKIPGGTLTAKLFRIVIWRVRDGNSLAHRENEKNATLGFVCALCQSGILNRGNSACLIIFVASGCKRD
jgi:hypothetical protein